MKFRLALYVPVMLVLASCARDTSSYPDLGEAPARPAPRLTPEQRQAVTQELEAAREQARRTATEGRETAAPGGEDAVTPDVVGESEDTEEDSGE